MDNSKNVFPVEIVEYSVEKHFNEYSTRTNVLYILVIGIFFIALVLLFILKVDLSVRSTGIIKPLQDKTEIKTAINGVLDSIFVAENTHVHAGQPLMIVHAQSLENNTTINTDKEEIQNQVNDLRQLLEGNDDSLKSNFYSQQYQLYRRRLADAQIRYNLIQRNFSRFDKLYKNKVIAPAEYDKYDYQRRAAESEISLLKEQQITQWQADYNKLSMQVNTMLQVVKAPVSGYVQQLKGLQRGSVVSPGEVLGEISPDSGMVAETYILPKDIGLLKIGTPVKMQIDAFDYNIWGNVTGKIESISNDIMTGDGQPYFKVRCRLNTQAMTLKNGYVGNLKKGMTLQARFLIAKRTLFQLLRDQTDDWLNPNVIKEPTVAKNN